MKQQTDAVGQPKRYGKELTLCHSLYLNRCTERVSVCISHHKLLELTATDEEVGRTNMEWRLNVGKVQVQGLA